MSKAVELMSHLLKIRQKNLFLLHIRAIHLWVFQEKLGHKWAANWEGFDINLASLAMAIEQTGNNSIGNLMMQDAEYLEAINKLVQQMNIGATPMVRAKMSLPSLEREDGKPVPLAQNNGFEKGVVDIFGHPNPTTGHFTLNVVLEEKVASDCVLVIYDVTGKVIYEEMLTGDSLSKGRKIDLHNENNGLYIVNVLSNETVGLDYLPRFRAVFVC